MDRDHTPAPKSAAKQTDTRRGNFRGANKGKLDFLAIASKTGVLAGDAGLRVFLATSAGVPGGSPELCAKDSQGNPIDLKYIREGWGRSIKPLVEKQCDYQASRQRQGLPVATLKQQKYAARVRGRIKNEAAYSLNRLFEAGPPSVFVTESLSFEGSEINAPLARLVQRMGHGVTGEWAERNCPRHGTRHVRVNAAYTSQGCFGCLHVSKENRPDGGELFSCVMCPHVMHADSEATLNERERFFFDQWLSALEEQDRLDLGLSGAFISLRMRPFQVKRALEARAEFMRDPSRWGKAVAMGALPPCLEARAMSVSGNWATRRRPKGLIEPASVRSRWRCPIAPAGFEGANKKGLWRRAVNPRF